MNTTATPPVRAVSYTTSTLCVQVRGDTPPSTPAARHTLIRLWVRSMELVNRLWERLTRSRHPSPNYYLDVTTTYNPDNYLGTWNTFSDWVDFGGWKGFGDWKLIDPLLPEYEEYKAERINNPRLAIF